MSTADKEMIAFLKGQVDAYEEILGGSLCTRGPSTPSNTIRELVPQLLDSIRETALELGIPETLVDTMFARSLKRLEPLGEGIPDIRKVIGTC